jgi:hypothetical protein
MRATGVGRRDPALRGLSTFQKAPVERRTLATSFRQTGSGSQTQLNAASKPQPPAKPEPSTTPNTTQSFCTPEYLAACAATLGEFLSLDKNSGAQEVNRSAQADKLFLWKPAGGDKRCVNSAWRGADPQKKQALMQEMPTLYPVVQPRLNKAPSVIVVPLGLHALNAVRLRALQLALEQLRTNFGPDALKGIHIYFVGGRTLMKEECLAMDQVMAAGLAFFCEAQWSELSKDQQNAFLRDFAEAQMSALGADGLQLTTSESQPLREKDSAKQIWTQAKGLASLRELIHRDHVHFHESKQRVAGKDNTHGNARLVLDKCLGHKTLTPGQAHNVLVCSDAYCLPRVQATFEGYLGQWGWEVTAFSASITGSEPQQQAEAHAVFTTLGLREAACFLNEQQEAAQNAQAWFQCEDLKQKYALPQ